MCASLRTLYSYSGKGALNFDILKISKNCFKNTIFLERASLVYCLRRGYTKCCQTFMSSELSYLTIFWAILLAWKVASCRLIVPWFFVGLPTNISSCEIAIIDGYVCYPYRLWKHLLCYTWGHRNTSVLCRDQNWSLTSKWFLFVTVKKRYAFRNSKKL